MHVLLVLELVAFTPQPRVGTMVSALVPPLARVSMSANAPSGDQENPMKKLISDLKFLGPLRFVVQGNGAILESVAEVGSVSYKTLDNGAELATLKADTGSSDFEAHLRLSELGEVRFETKQKADGSTPLYLLRFINQSGSQAMTLLLHAEKDGYDEDAVEFYEGLRKHFGDSVTA